MHIDYTRSMRFRLNSEMSPAGDQPQAIETVSGWIDGGAKASTLLGVTGSGKTFSMMGSSDPELPAPEKARVIKRRKREQRKNKYKATAIRLK